MEAEEQLFWQLFDQVLLSIELENQIIEDIVLGVEDDDWEDYEDLVNDVNQFDHEDLHLALNAAVGRLMELEILNLEAEEAAVLEMIYRRNERVYDWRALLPRMEYFRTLEDPTFLHHFRMDRGDFERLIVVMGNHLVEQGRLIRLRTEIDKCLLMALWILFNMETFRATGVIFGVSRGTVHCHYIVVIEALRELAPRYIKWPSQQERVRIKQSIEERTGYPGVIGMIDGTLIRITAPVIQKERYYDRHQSYSLNVQAVCDDNLLFRDVYMGQPGSVHDCRVFERSALYNLLLERRQDVAGDDEHIIGDGGGGYECMEKVGVMRSIHEWKWISELLTFDGIVTAFDTVQRPWKYDSTPKKIQFCPFLYSHESGEVLWETKRKNEVNETLYKEVCVRLRPRNVIICPAQLHHS